jgi:hypothetical protein
VVAVEADPEEWLYWAERYKADPGATGRAGPDGKAFRDARAWVARQGVHPDVIGYVRSDRADIFHDTNPRAWGMVSKIVWAAEALKPDRAVLEAAVAGALGAGADGDGRDVGNVRAAAFRRFRKQGFTPPTGEELIGSYGGKYRTQVKKWVAEGKTDVLGALADSALLMLQPREGYEAVRGDKKRWKALGDFLDDLPADLANEVRADLRERGREIPAVARRRS